MAAQADFLESKKEWQAEATKIQQDSHEQEKKFAQVQEEALKKFFATPTPRSSEEIEKERAAGDEVKREYWQLQEAQKYLGSAPREEADATDDPHSVVPTPIDKGQHQK